MKRIYIVTGAAGFVGNNVVKILAAQGNNIRVLVNSPGKEKISLKGINAEIFYGDIRKPADIEQLFKKDESCEYIFIHAASVVDIKSNRFNQNLYDINVNGTKNVLTACNAHKVKRLVYVSSVHAIQEPAQKSLTKEPEGFCPTTVHGVYAKTKTEASASVLEAVKEGLNAVMVHPSGIIGPDDYSNTHMTQMLVDFAEHRIPGGVNGGYDFVDVRDVAKAIIAACDSGKAGSRWIISGNFISIPELFNIISEILGLNKRLPVFPMWAARLGLPFLLLFAKLTKKRPLYTPYALYTLRSNGNFCHDRATAELGHMPLPIRETLGDTLEFLKAKGFLNI